MNTLELQQALAARVNAQALEHLQGVIDLDCRQGTLTLHIQGQQLSWLTKAVTADVTFYFHSPTHAYELLCGSADVMAEFMSGRFRSSGYLLWTFPLLGLFRG